MAFFKTRKGGDEPVATPRPAESIEALRRRARHRLIGAAVLVLVGIVGFPVLFDTQPRPIPVNIPIDIPDRNKAQPLPAPAPVSQAPAASGASPARVVGTPAAASAVKVAEAPVAKPEAKAVSRPEQKADSKPAAEPRPEAAPQHAPVAVAKAEPAKAEPPPAKHDDAAKAQALLDGRPASSSQAAVEGRYVVQVGSFSDAAKARETRMKVERAGLKTYAQSADTKLGKRIRVRVGPFGTRAEADKAANRIKGLALPAAILSL